ncbi:MAG: serine/threonine-protein kinase [Myxococcota bacterium]
MVIRCKRCGAEGGPGRCTGCGHRSTPVHGPLEGRRLGERTLGETLGRGAMGTVYTVEGDRSLAVKVLHAELASGPSGRRFAREARACLSLDHPHLLRVYESVPGPPPHLVMERLEGRTLLEWRDTASDEERLAVFQQVLAALQHGHERGVVHRDLKAENVMVQRRGSGWHAVLCDFGLAKLVEGSGTVITEAGFVCGTPAYMAPEQIRGAAVSAQTDVYGAGCLLFVLLTGTLPFRAANVMDTLAAHVADPVPSLVARRGKDPWSVRLDPVIRRAMAKDPTRRFASAQAFSQAIEHAFAPNPRLRWAFSASLLLMAAALAGVAYALMG